MVLGVSLALLPPRSNAGSGLEAAERMMSLGNWGMDGTLLRTVKTRGLGCSCIDAVASWTSCSFELIVATWVGLIRARTCSMSFFVDEVLSGAKTAPSHHVACARTTKSFFLWLDIVPTISG